MTDSTNHDSFSDLENKLREVTFDDAAMTSQKELMNAIEQQAATFPAEQGSAFAAFTFGMMALAACALAGVLYFTFYQPQDNFNSTELDSMSKNAVHFASAQELQSNIRISGIVSQYAMIQDKQKKEQKTYRVGDSLYGYVITAIHDDKIDFKSKSDEDEIFSLKITGEIVDPNAKPENVSAFKIRGTVLRDGKPVDKTRVTFYTKSGFAFSGLPTKADGKYVINDITRTVVAAQPYSAYLPIFTRRGEWSKDATVNLELDTKNAFILKGRALDHQGKGILYCQFTFYDVSGIPLNLRTRSNKKGEYSFKAYNPVSYLKAVAPYEKDLWIVKNGPWKSDARVDVDFSNAGYFILSGNIIKADKQKIKVSIQAFGNSGQEVWTHPDKDGSYSLRAREIIHNIRLHIEKKVKTDKVAGNGKPARTKYLSKSSVVEKRGPWKADSTVNFDLSKEKTFTLAWKTDKSLPNPGTQVRLFDDKNVLIPHGDISEIYSNVKVNYLIVDAMKDGKYLNIRMDGPWTEDAVLTIEPEKLRMFTLKGQIAPLDIDAEFNIQTIVYYTKDHEAIQNLAVRNGDFEISTNQSVDYMTVFAFNEKKGLLLKGPWDKETDLTVDFNNENLFTLKGTVTNKEGKLLHSTLNFYYQDGVRAGNLSTNANGQFTFECNSKITHITFRDVWRKYSETSKQGPWSTDREIVLQIESE